MIWIQSCENDGSTNMVIDWLIYFGSNWFRTNEEEVKFETISLSEEGVKMKLMPKMLQRTISFEEITSYWYRRGHISLGLLLGEKEYEYRAYNQFLVNETGYIKDFLYESLKGKKSINNFLGNSLNKLTVLHEAVKAGLKIPVTFIIHSKKELKELLSQKRYITKSLTVSSVLRTDGYGDSWGTVLVDSKVIEDNDPLLEPAFFPSLIQECIQKRFEIRTFFLGDEIYSSAILSQNDPQTIIDFRNYNHDRPNRVIPYQLPQDIEDKIRALALKLNLSSGSIDLLYGTDKEYYFLEVNHIGQFFQVSHPCNYRLEKKVATYLSA